jgi:phthiocerol/phenolphthiocerol synthesis type-I polyketide synthase E
MVEVGPGQTLMSLVRQNQERPAGNRLIGTMRHPREEADDREYLAGAIGKVWMAGVEVDWSRYHEGERRRRVGLPTYPFERQRYWIEAGGGTKETGRRETGGKKADVSEWFYAPGWQTKGLRRSGTADGAEGEKKKKYIVMEGRNSLSRKLVERLRTENAEVIRVRAGGNYQRVGEREYEVRAGERQDYEELLKEVMRSGDEMIEVLHLWSLGGEWGQVDETRPEERFRCEQQRGFYSLLSLAQAFATLSVSAPIKIDVICDNLYQVGGAEGLSPEKTTLLAFCKVIPQEAPHVSCHSIDIVLPRPESKEEAGLIDRLIAEIETDSPDVVIAYRSNRRWVQSFEPLRLERCAQSIRPLRANGVYLITGGLGGVGLLLADHLAQTQQAKLVLTGRSMFPERSAWAPWLASHGEGDEISLKIRRLQAMEAAGAEIMVASVDLVDENRMNALVASTLQRFGALHGVLHAAGITSGPSVFKPFTEIGTAETESQFQPKGYGLYVLERVLQNIEIDFCLLFSSNASVLGGLGLVAYAAANTFMDAFAWSRHATRYAPWISATWDAWPEETKRYTGYQTSVDQYTMTAEESVDAFERLITSALDGQVVVSTGDLPGRLDLWIHRRGLRGEPQSIDPSSLHPRPDIASLYVAPRTEVEQTIAGIWRQILGLELVGIYDDFFSLGGHSILATKLVGRLGDAFQVELTIGKFFQSPTVAGLAQTVSDLQAEQQEREQNELLDILSQLSDTEVESEIRRLRDFETGLRRPAP